MSAQRIAVLTSGGDAPGMNAALRAAALTAQRLGLRLFGVRDGFSGLIRGEFLALEDKDIGESIRRGGTQLGSARCPEFHERAARDQARLMLKSARIHHLLTIGGNGTLAGARALSDPAESAALLPELRVVGIPASIDNDIGYTSMAIGVDTAMNTIIEACDRIADTAQAHHRTFLIEVMGRDSGYLAMSASLAVGADVVLFREAGKSLEAQVAEICDAIAAARTRPNRRVIVLKSEGLSLSIDHLRQEVERELARRSAALATTEVRVVVLGHVVRGGSPSAFDRLMASRLGSAAIRALHSGRSSVMVAWNPTQDRRNLQHDPLDPRCWLIPLDEVERETQAMRAGQSQANKTRISIFEQIERILRP